MIPTRIIFDAATNVYLTSGPIQTGNAPDQHASNAQDWITAYFERAAGSHYVRAFYDAVRDGYVDNSTEGRLAWLDLYSQGKIMRRPDGSLGYRRDRDQSLTVRLYCALALEEMTGELPPFPGSLIAAEGWATWDDVASEPEPAVGV
jgi:hypothetical protein